MRARAVMVLALALVPQLSGCVERADAEVQTPVAVAAAAAAAAAPVTGGPGDLLAKLAGNIDSIDEIFEPAAEAARSNITQIEELSFGNSGPVIGPRRHGKGGWCRENGLDGPQGQQAWCPQACLSCWKRDHAQNWLDTGDDAHLVHVRLVRALDRKDKAVARLQREMQGLRNSTVAMEISAAELQAKLAGKQLWVDVMLELETVAGLVLRELDSMASDGHPEHAAALPGGTEQLKDVLQAVQYSVMLAERARVALFGNAKELVELDVLPCVGVWGEWSSCAANSTSQQRPCCTPCPKNIRKKKIPARQREEAAAYGVAVGDEDRARSSERIQCSINCANMSIVGVSRRVYHILTPAQHGGQKCSHENEAIELATCSLAPLVCLPKGANATGPAVAGVTTSSPVPPSAATGDGRSTASSGSLAGQLERVIEDAGNAADAAEERHAQSASAAVANAVDGGFIRGANGQGESVIMAELETVVRTGSNNLGRGNAGDVGVEEIKTGALIDGHDNQYTLMRPHDLTVPHQDVGLVEELLITLSACFLMGAAFRFVGLPSFLGHMAAGTILGPMGLGKLRHMVQLDSLGQFGVELFLFVLGLELDVNAFAAGPTARLSATVAIVLTVVLVIGCLAFALVFGTSLSDAVIVGGCLALSSTPVAVGALTKEEHRQPHGELLLGVLIVQDGIFGVFLAALSAMGDGAGDHGSPGTGDGNGGEGSGRIRAGELLVGGLGSAILGVGCWFIRRRLHHMHNLCCRQNRMFARCVHQLGTRICGSWLYKRVVGATSASDEAVLLGALCAMATGRTVTEELGMSGEIGCLLMGLSVLPISSALRRSGAGRQQLSIGREPSPRETIRATHDGHHGYPLSLDDDTEQHRLLDHRIGGSDDEEAGVSSKQSTAPAGFVPESHSGEMSSTTMPNEPSKLEGRHGHAHSGGRVVEIVMPVRDLLISLFFASCGQHLSPGFMRDLLGTLASLALVAMGLKYIIVAGTLRLLSSATASIQGPDTRSNSEVLNTVSLTAAGLAQISEVSFFIAARAKRQRLIGRETHFVLLATTSLSLAFAPLLWATVSFFAGNQRRNMTGSGARK